MINKISISNFQSHKKSQIELGKNINVIYGLSDSGKSGFLRAILSVIERKPFYLTNGATSGRVDIDFTEGNQISREYTKKKLQKCPDCKSKLIDNTQTCSECGCFISDKPSADKYFVNGEQKDKFGAKLPSFITEITRMYPYSFVDVHPFINVFTQHEDMFFIGKSYDGRYRNRLISALVVDSEKIDKLLKDGMSKKYQNNTTIKILTKERKDIDKKLKNTDTLLSELEMDNELIDELENQKITYQNDIKRLTNIAEKLTETAIPDILYDTVDKYIKLMSKMQNTVSKLESYYENAIKLKSIRQKLKLVGNIDIVIPKKIEFDPMKLLEIDNKITELSTLKDRINMTNKQIKITNDNISEISNKIAVIKTEFEQYLKSDNTVCPITKERFEKDCLNKILKMGEL